MTRVFVSYSRKQGDKVRVVVADLELGGHEVWIDRELSGGQRWWDEVLLRIRECQVFAAALSQEFTDSEACTRELRYAIALGKPILPVQVADLSSRLLPRNLAEMQWVDYRASTKESALLMLRALARLPATPPLPTPLPPPPDVPVSYLDTLKQQVEAPGSMTREQQQQLVWQLRDRMRGDEVADVQHLLRRYRQRADLLVSTAEEIDDLLARPVATAPLSRLPAPSASASMSNSHSGASASAAAVGTQGVAAPAATGQAVTKPPSYMGWAIAVTLAGFFFPIGIVAIVFASKVDANYRAGDHDAAAKASRTARIWVIVAVVVVALLYLSLASTAQSESGF